MIIIKLRKLVSKNRAFIYMTLNCRIEIANVRLLLNFNYYNLPTMKKIILIILINIGVFSLAHAQMSIGFSAAPVFPAGNFVNMADLGYGFGFSGNYTTSESVIIGIGVQHYRFGLSPLGFKVPGVNFALTPVTASVAFTPKTGPVKPYIGIGAGIYNFKIDSFIDVSRSYFGLAPKVGILYSVSNKIDFHADAAYNVVFVNESIPLTEISFKQNITFIPINIGIAVKF